MKIRNYLCISIFLILFLIISKPALSQINPGEIQHHEANEEIIWDWFSYVPTSITKTELSYILVSTYAATFDYDVNIDATRGGIWFRKDWADLYGYILLCPAIPRSRNPDLYTIAFDKSCFLESTDPFYQRPDFKVNIMIDKLISDLKQEGYNVHNKVFVEGFSAGGMFAQRYCLLHPERLQAIAGGQCGGYLTLPESTYDEATMGWAIGINDFLTLVGYEFNDSVYKQVPQFIYIGDEDTNNSHFLYPNPEGFWTQAQIDFINNIFGDSDPIRLSNQCRYIEELGYNITFKLYPGVGHTLTPDMIDDTFKFFAQYRYTGDGDIAPLGNRDGQVTVGDALVALRFALGFDTPTQQDIYHGDVAPQASNGQPNPDGVITVGDALVILRMALGLIMQVDGDPKEWSGMAPLGVDPQGDSLCGANADIKAVYTTIDDNYAYVMVETYGRPIHKDATMEINFNYKPGHHILGSLLDDLHTNISRSELYAWTDNDLDGNMEEYPIAGYTVTRGDVLEVKIPLSAIENATYFRPTFVNIWDNAYNQFAACDNIQIQNQEREESY